MRGDERALATFLFIECIMMLVYHNMPRFNDPYLYQSMYRLTVLLRVSQPPPRETITSSYVDDNSSLAEIL